MQFISLACWNLHEKLHCMNILSSYWFYIVPVGRYRQFNSTTSHQNINVRFQQHVFSLVFSSFSFKCFIAIIWYLDIFFLYALHIVNHTACLWYQVSLFFVLYGLHASHVFMQTIIVGPITVHFRGINGIFDSVSNGHLLVSSLLQISIIMSGQM